MVLALPRIARHLRQVQAGHRIVTHGLHGPTDTAEFSEPRRTASALFQAHSRHPLITAEAYEVMAGSFTKDFCTLYMFKRGNKNRFINARQYRNS